MIDSAAAQSPFPAQWLLSFFFPYPLLAFPLFTTMCRFRAVSGLLPVLILLLVSETPISSGKRTTYIVHMDKTKLRASYQAAATSKQLHHAVLHSVHRLSQQQQEYQSEKDGTPPQLLHSYEHALFGFAARLSEKQLKALQKVDGFLSAVPDRMMIIGTTHTPKFLGLQGNRGLWSASNLNSDVIIGVVDTGIWPEHPSFHDKGLPVVPSRWRGVCETGHMFTASNCNRKIIGARAFRQGYEAEYEKLNETVEYLSVRDKNGHGTHTASTAAGSPVQGASLLGLANGTAAGMMYTARIAIYKACWADGACSTADIVAAVEHAIRDGVDILSLSIYGGSTPYFLDPSTVAFFAAASKGIFVSTIAGNSGPDPFTVSNNAPWITTVAASNSDRSFPTVVKLGNGRSLHGISMYSGQGTKQLPLVYDKTAGGHKFSKYCIRGSLDPKLVKGRIVICEEGGITDLQMGEQVKLAGGAGAIIVQRTKGEIRAFPHLLPATPLGAMASKSILEYLNSSRTPTASIDFRGTRFGIRAPVIAEFSSRGPSIAGLAVIKPDVTAPGVDILAAWPITSPLSEELEDDKRRSNYNIISGTSMACPHVTGIVALLKSAHKAWSPAAIKSALMTTAYTMDNKGSPILDGATGLPATPFMYGSGHIDPRRAADPGLIYDITPKDYLHFLCSLGYDTFEIAVFNGYVDEDFSCEGYETKTPTPGDLNYPSFSLLFRSGAKNNSVTYRRTATNVGTARSSYDVKVEEPEGVLVSVNPVVLSFERLGQKLSYTVTFRADETRKLPTFSFGSLVWISGQYQVRSPIAMVDTKALDLEG